MSLIVGLGSPHGDDQLGWVAIDLIRPRLPAGVSAQKIRGGLDLLECLEGHDTVVIVDASAPAGRPGLIRSFAWPCPELPELAPWSTHGLELVEALQLAETLGLLPRNLVIYTIEARDISPLAALGDDIARQAEGLVETILADRLSVTAEIFNEPRSS